MTHLTDIFSTSEYDQAVRQGWIRVQSHPYLPYKIANYSERAVIEKVWNPVTTACRGLIFDDRTGEVIARPFRKFFNHNESTAPVFGLHDPVIVTDKQDGSLGILFPTPNGYQIATRGSFTSEQALHASALYEERYVDSFRPIEGITYLFEIIYPENRIVVDYGRMDDLVLLGAVDIATGRSITPEVIQRDARHAWPGPVTTTFSYSRFSEALAAAPRPGMEGLVVHNLLSDERVKIKYSEYVVLHRLVTGLTSRRVHEAMVAGVDLDEFIAPLPDEFHDWVREIARRIDGQVEASEKAIELQWQMVIAECEEQSPELEETPASAEHPLRGNAWPMGMGMGMRANLDRDQRKLFADVARKYSFAWALFSRLDGKDYHAKLLQMAKPEEIETPNGRFFSEATA